MKAIVSVLGKDQTGIIAKVSMTLFEMSINIEDISQTIMQSQYFTMIMVVEMPESITIEKVNDRLQVLALDMGLDIRIQHEDIFNKMHRI
ncbi:MAG TPA: ACT domain-containing protein [Clostridia bacterium]|nr:ACT domain-containing protein [Clostridia bacterium]